MVGFLAGCFALQACVAKCKAGPVKALAIRYVVIPFYEVVVVDKIYSKGPHGVPGYMKGIFLSVFTNSGISCKYIGG